MRDMKRTIHYSMPEIGQWITIWEVEKYNSAAGGKWFSESNMRVFKSRVYEDVRPVKEGWLFVSSELDWNGARRYTVRMMNPEGSIVESPIGETFGFMTKRAADRAMIRYWQGQQKNTK